MKYILLSISFVLLVLHEGYTQNFNTYIGYASLKTEYEGLSYHHDDIRISIGYLFNNMDVGSYYGYGRRISFKTNDSEIIGNLYPFHSFGAYCNYHFLPLLIENKKITQYIDIYVTAKFGGYYFKTDPQFYPNGVGINIFGGAGIIIKPLNWIGIFSEYGYDAFPKNNNIMGSGTLRFGIYFKFTTKKI